MRWAQRKLLEKALRKLHAATDLEEDVLLTHEEAAALWTWIVREMRTSPESSPDS